MLEEVVYGSYTTAVTLNTRLSQDIDILYMRRVQFLVYSGLAQAHPE